MELLDVLEDDGFMEGYVHSLLPLRHPKQRLAICRYAKKRSTLRSHTGWLSSHCDAISQPCM